MNRLTDINQISEKRSWFHPPEAIETFRLESEPTIVLAEDDDLLREIFSLNLIGRGFEVRCAADGNQAWELLCEGPFALLITDHEMPGLMGLELVRKMRMESLCQPAILISANMPWNSPDLCELLSPGATLEKPFATDELVEVMCAMLAFQGGIGITQVSAVSALSSRR